MEKHKFKKADIILIDTRKYIIYDLKKDYVELLSIEDINESPDFILKFKIAKNILNCGKRLDQEQLLWLINVQNPMIKKVLEIYLKDGS